MTCRIYFTRSLKNIQPSSLKPLFNEAIFFKSTKTILPRICSMEACQYSTGDQQDEFAKNRKSENFNADRKKEFEDIYYEKYDQIYQELKDREERKSAVFQKFGGISWKSLALFLCLAIPSFYYVRSKKMALESEQKNLRSYGNPQIGGRFVLTDHLGRQVTSSHYAGKYVLIYFGFTFCPDICPAEMKKASDAIELIGEQADLVQPVMITVDPWRDSVERLRSYVSDFHRSFVGLTGTPQQIDRVCRVFRVYASKAPDENEDDYLVDHSIFMYLMDKNFKFIDYFGVDMDAESIAERITQHMIANGDKTAPGMLQKFGDYFAGFFKQAQR